ncbi:glutamate receptor 3.2 isoform X1 [Cryptomeria japonica]|uniref:glutamate receptor 3.2 isoform X1 n=1 Tax=Cryptomeria japonica TaxID=3369 RepID=UPI0027D9F658|nr:glutamate receptor 3.2 isoform X1 [Cryptomeria japonica]
MFLDCTTCDVQSFAMKHLVYLLLLLSMGLCDARPPEVRIGGVFNLGSYQGKQSNVAIQLAIQDVNNDPKILNGTLLQLKTAEIGSTALIDAGNVLQLFRANVVSVVAPMTAQISNLVSFLADSAQVPLITFAGNDPSMSLKHSAYSMQMIGRDVLQMKAIAALLNNFQWREIVVIYQEDELGLSGILALKNALQEISARIVQKFGVSDESFSNFSWKNVAKRLEGDMTRSRVFVIHTSYGLAQKIFLEAKQSGIMKELGGAWVVTEWVASSLEIADDTTMDSMQGVIGVRIKITHTPHFENISMRWKEKFMRLYPNVTHSENIGIVGAYAYDSVRVIAKAIDDLFRDNKLAELEFKSSGKTSTDAYVFQEGNALFQKAVNSNLEGIIGKIKFSNSGLLEIHSYDIVNVVNREIRVVGSWVKEELKLSGVEIMWPNGSSKTPCGFRKFIVGVPPNVVFPGFINIKDNNKLFNGFCIEVFKKAVTKLNCPFDYEFKVSENSDKNPNYDTLVQQVANKIFDAVVADITILSDRSENVDFTQPYTDTGLVIMVPIKNTKSSGWAFMKPFTLSMWLTALAFILLTAFLLWLFERNENDAFTGETARQLEISLWFSFATIVFVQGEKIMTSLGKVILMVWLFVVLILNSSYTASLASYVTVQQLSPTIRDTESLRASNTSIGHMDGSFVENYLIDELRIDKNRLRAFTKATDYVDSLRSGSIGAVVDETPYINMLMSENCGEFEIVSRPFYRGGFGFVFAKGCPVVPEMTSAVLNITQNKTELDSIRSCWFGSDSCNDDKSNVSQEQGGNDIGRLSPKTFWGLFVISTGIYCALLSAYLVSRFCKGRINAVKVQPIPQENPVPAIQFVALDPNLLHSRGVRRSYTALPPLNVDHQQSTSRLHSA